MENRYRFGEKALGNTSVNLTFEVFEGIVKTLLLRVLSSIDLEF